MRGEQNPMMAYARVRRNVATEAEPWLDAPWIDQELGQGWIARFRILKEGGRPMLGEVIVFPDGDGAVPLGGLPANVLRRIRLGDVYEMLGENTAGRQLGFKEEAAKAPHRPGRRGRPDIFYAKLAQDYVALLDDGERHPVHILADEPDERWNDESVRQLLVIARHRGLLSPAPSGRAGGHLTAKARQVLGGEKP